MVLMGRGIAKCVTTPAAVRPDDELHQDPTAQRPAWSRFRESSLPPPQFAPNACAALEYGSCPGSFLMPGAAKRRLNARYARGDAASGGCGGGAVRQHLEDSGPA